MTIKAEAKTLYHASAVVASNYLVTLLDLSFRLIKAAGITDRDAFKALKPLIQGTLSNIEKVGIVNGLTGPVVRGDIETVKRYLEEIGSKTPDLLNLYKTLGFHTIDIAMAGGQSFKIISSKPEKDFHRLIPDKLVKSPKCSLSLISAAYIPLSFVPSRQGR